MRARLIEVIEVEVERGDGSDEDFCRMVTQYWSTKGRLLAESDPDRYCVDGDNYALSA